MLRTALLLSVGAALLLPAAVEAGDPLLAPEHVCPNPALSAPAHAQVKAMLCYHGYARRRLALRVLRPSPSLYRSAGLKLRWIIGCRAFSHRPCGRPFNSAFSDANYTYGTWKVGENLAWGSGEVGRVRNLFGMWLHSPGHRRNITRPEWGEIGVSHVRTVRILGYPNVTVWVAHFGTH
jgi:uncharacterized protein YkwD